MIQLCENLDLKQEPLATNESSATLSDSIVNTITTISINGYSEEAEISADGDDETVTLELGQASTAMADASSSNNESQYPPDVKVGFDELCPVCGDKVSGYHYGLLTCESCKGFFKRTVQNKKVYSCVDNRSCHIDKSQRKRCPYCRFQKCLNVGMKLEAVRQDRMRGGRNKFGPMYKRDRALKQQQFRQQHRMMADCEMSMTSDPGSPVDIKPDPALLQASMGMAFSPSTGNLANAAELSSVAAAMAAAAVSAASVVNHASASSGYMSASHTTSMAGLGRGAQASSGGNSPLHLDDSGAGALNLHAPHHPGLPHTSPTSHTNHHPHHNNHHVSGGNNLHLHQHPLADSYLLQQQSSPGYHGGAASNVNSSGSVLDAFRAYAVSAPPPPSLPPLLREIKANLLEEDEVKQKMLSFLTDAVGQVDGHLHPEQLLLVVCRMIDQLLFLMVEWARNSPFFKEMKVEDQMKLLQHSWSEILILDFVYRQVHEHWGTELTLPNNHSLNFETLEKLGLSDVRVRLFELIKKSSELKLDYNEYMCLKFLVLLNPDVSGLENRNFVERSQEKVNAALHEYCFNFYPEMKDKFGQILLRLPEIRVISIRMEEFLYFKHLNNQVPDQTLLTEMLHSKRK